MKRWMMVLMGLTLILGATTGTVFALTGDGNTTPEQEDTGAPNTSGVCAEDTPDCIDTIVVGDDDEGVGEPEPSIDVGEPYPMPDPGSPKEPGPDTQCDPDQAVSITSDGQVSCLDLEPSDDTDVPGREPGGQVDPLPPIAPVEVP